ncbi:metal-dependent transcriptional regulator [Flavobacteriaceae bacterium XHP0103]|uniref:metal-dependent transcriptional regulator n=1 Tax=Marixanthotalea marina TaxID=2844359 RepID=UPI002989DC6E|nr:metal-dependent transcriptional regulator [Marixanthotalea marina]MBU3820764.1 metal-dependent transcriptional regulator [Marixanthotalea marina]
MVTLSEENYLKAIYHLGKQGMLAVTTNAIAEQMDTKASSVTDMLKKLSDKNLANYVKYQGVSLTEEGRLAAALVVRKHRLWEVFLVEKLQFSWDEVHDIAEQLEHIKSLKLVDELDAFLGCPTHDPHGDPIPDKHGNIGKMNKIFLAQLNPNDHCICIGVSDSSADFLKYLDKHQIALGTSIEIISKETFDESMTIKVNNALLNISKIVSNNIYVKKA